MNYFNRLREIGTVWTIGSARLEPGAASIIPGRAELALQFRDQDEDRLDRMQAAVRSLAEAATREGPVEVTVTPARTPITPTRMDAALQQHLADAAAGRDAWDVGCACRARPATIRWCSRIICPARCSSSPASTASATISPRIPSARTSRLGCQVAGASRGERAPGREHGRSRTSHESD